MNKKLMGCFVLLTILFLTFGAVSATDVSEDTNVVDDASTISIDNAVQDTTPVENMENNPDSVTTISDNSLVTVGDDEVIDGNGATYTNTSFKVTGNNVVLKNFQVNDEDIEKIIDATGVNNLTIDNIQIVSTKSSGASFGIDFTNTTNSLINNCVITVSAPSQGQIWNNDTGYWYSTLPVSAILLDGSQNVNVTGNTISIESSTPVTSGSTMPAVTIKNNAQNIKLEENVISASGASYVYGIMMNDIVSNINVLNNNVTVTGPLYVAGIDASTSTQSTVSGNKIIVTSNNPSGNYASGTESLAYGVILATYTTGNTQNTVSGNTITLTGNVAYAIENIYGTQNNINNNQILINAKRGLGIATHTSNNNHYDNNNITINCNQDSINSFYEMIAPTNVGIIIINGSDNQVNNNQIIINENSDLNTTYAIILDETSTWNTVSHNILQVYDSNNNLVKQGDNAVINDNISNTVEYNTQNINVNGLQKITTRNVKTDDEWIVINEDNLSTYAQVSEGSYIRFRYNMSNGKFIIDLPSDKYAGNVQFRDLSSTSVQILSINVNGLALIRSSDIEIVNSYLPNVMLSSFQTGTFTNCTFLDLDDKYGNSPILENTTFIADNEKIFTLSVKSLDSPSYYTKIYSDFFDTTTNILLNSISNDTTIIIRTPYVGYGSYYGEEVFAQPMIINTPINLTSVDGATWVGDITFVSGSEGSNLTDMILNGTVYINTTDIGLYNNTINKGVVIKDSADNNIEGNTFNTEAEAITLTNTILTNIKGNDITSQAEYAVVLDADSIENTISGNNIFAAEKTSDAAVSADRDTNTVSGNLPHIPTTIVVTQDNIDEIFSGFNYTLGDNVFDGDTLDFQGTIDIEHQLIVNKQVNITSTTEDAFISLHSAAGDRSGNPPDNSFIFNIEVSGSTIEKLHLYNTEFFVHNVYNAVFRNMTMYVEDSPVGNGIGQSTLRYSNNVTLENCYIYTKNNGGSSSFVWTGSNNCTIINSTIQGDGNVGNILFVGNIYNIEDMPANYTKTDIGNNVINCTIIGGSGGISNALQNTGVDTLISGNKFYSGGSASSGTNGTFIDNEFYRTVSMSLSANSVAHGNVFYGNGSATIQANAQAYDNVFHNATVSGANVLFENNTVKSRLTVSGISNIVNSVLNDVQINSGARGINVTGNNVTGTITSLAQNVTIKNNNITTKNDYAIFENATNNVIIDNYITTPVKAGEDAINSIQPATIENNLPEAGKTVIITDETYSQYFDANGKLTSDEISNYDKIILTGVFNDKVFDIDSVKVTIDGDEAVINNGYFSSSNAATLAIQYIIINNTDDVEHSVIFESDLNTLRNVTINRYSREGTTQEVYVSGNENTIVNSTFDLDVATQTVDFSKSPAMSEVSAVTIVSSNNKVQNNKFNIKTSKNDYGTLNVIDIASADEANKNTITQNVINVEGTDYIYAINMGINTNENTVTSNNITLTSDNYAAGIQIMNGPSNDNTINSNNINITSTSAAYGVLITAWENPEVSGNIFNSNKINVTADQAFGMEMYSSNPEIVIKDSQVNSNTIKAEGTYAMGIVFNGKDSTINLNTLTVMGTTNETMEDSYDTIKPTTTGILFQDSDNLQAYNNTMNTTNGANYRLINTNNTDIMATTTVATRYINSYSSPNVVLQSSNGNTISTQKTYTDGDYSVELTASSNNIISNNILNASNLVGGNDAVYQDADSNNNTVENNKPVFELLTEETYATLFDENGVYTYPEGIEILTLAGDLYNKDLIFNNNVTFVNSKNYTIYNGTIYLNENPNGSYTNRFVYLNDININNVNKPAIYDNLTTTQQRNIQYYGGSITVTGDQGTLVGIYSLKDHATYAILDIERVNVNMNGNNVMFAIMSRPSLSSNDYIKVTDNVININSTGLGVVIYDEFVNIDLLRNNITQTGGQAVTVYADSAYANGKFFGENNINITADSASALILRNGKASNPTVGNNNITVTSPNPSVVINITDSGNAYVGQGSYTSASYNYPNRIIVNGYNGEVPVVTVTPNGYVRNNFIMSTDVWGMDAVVANTRSNITPTGIITDRSYSDYFDNEGYLKSLFNNSNLVASGAINNKDFLFNGVNVNITSDGTAKLNNTEIWTGNDAKVKLDGFEINNTKNAVVFESEGNILNNTIINIESEDPIHAIYVYEDGNTIANTKINVVAPSADVEYNDDYSTKAPAPAAIVISSDNNLVDNVAITFDGSESTGYFPTVDGIYVVSESTPVKNNTIKDTNITVSGANYVYGINVGNAKDTTIENVNVEVESEYYADAIQLFDADTITITGTAKATADSEAYGVYSTAMGYGFSQNIDLTGLDVTVDAPKATGVLIEGASNIMIADATYDIKGDQATAVKAHVDWMENIPTNITVTGLDITIDTTGDANILYFGKASDVTITDNHIEANAGGAINFNATPNAVVTDNYILVGEMLETGIFGNYAVITTEDDTVVENNTPSSQVIDDLNDKISELEDLLEELTRPKETTITIDPLENVRYGDEITITGTLVNEDSLALSNQEVTIVFNDEEVTVKTRNGEFKYATTAAIVGENTITVTYAGSDKYLGSDAEYTFEVAKADTIINLTDIEAVKKGEVAAISGILYDHNGNALANKVVRLLVNNGRKTVKTNDMGEFSFDYTTTKVGEMTLTATFEGDDLYEATTTETAFEVNALATIITIDPMDTIIKGTQATITGTLTDENGNAIANAQVRITINGSPKTLKTDSEGRFTHTYTMGQVGENTITATYAGSVNYEAAECETTVEVAKAQPVITIDPIESVNLGESATITGTLTDADGNAIANAQVKVFVNGSPKTLKTDANGAFTHTFKMTKEGTNNITATFNGNNDFELAEATSTVEVIKAE